MTARCESRVTRHRPARSLRAEIPERLGISNGQLVLRLARTQRAQEPPRAARRVRRESAGGPGHIAPLRVARATLLRVGEYRAVGIARLRFFDGNGLMPALHAR